MRLLLLEHQALVGPDDSARHRALAAPGLAMLSALAEDFSALGLEVVVPLHESVKEFAVDSVQVHLLAGPQALREPIHELARRCDAALVIAPEQDQLLERWTQRMESLGLEMLGSSSAAVALVGDKFQLMNLLTQAGVPVPATFLADEPSVDQWPSPLILKPRWGAGCLQTRLWAGSSAIPPSVMGRRIVQEYIPGQPVSLGALVSGQQILPLKPCRQNILTDDDGTLSYQGGQGPLPQELAARAWRLASAALATLSGLRGFVGVDLVLGDSPQADRLIEINPRVTMSYLMMRRLCRQNLATGFLQPLTHLSWHEAQVSMDALGRVTLEPDDEP